MQQIEWIFSGIGTQIVAYIVSFAITGFIGYKILIHRSSVKQIQKADNNAVQVQIIRQSDDSDYKSKISKNSTTQKQVAGFGSKQTQNGEIKNGNNRESQKAGDNATQLQAQIININQGIDEKRARDIFKEMYQVARKDITQEAFVVAQERVNAFEEKLIPKMEGIKGALSAFGDPSFQLLLTKAHKSAASSDSELDYDLLSELLIYRIENGDKRKVKAEISKAVEIVDEIDYESLNGLTLAYVVSNFVPTSESIRDCLKTLNEFYKSIVVHPLPTGKEWLDNLDILNAMRVSNIDILSLMKFNEYLEDIFSGTFRGILKESDELESIKVQLNENGIPITILVENELDSRFMRLKLNRINEIENLRITQQVVRNDNVCNSKIPFTEKQKNVLKNIFNSSMLKGNYIEEIRKTFEKEIEKYPYILEVENWWNKIPGSFNITPVGKVLAHANAKRLYPAIPKWEN